MIKLLNFVPVQLSCFLVLGIITGNYFFVEMEYLTAMLITAVVVFSITYILVKQKYFTKNTISILGFMVLFLIGFSSINFRNIKNKNNHYTQYLTEFSEALLVQLKVEEVLKPSAYYTKYEVQLNSINKTNYTGKLLLQIKKDSEAVNLNIDDVIFAKAKLKSINKPL
ncbi:MAG TPA: DUF4131 domain-containing protein, partial [Flavobacteriaceae bacterium]|nr:DUF4131 domain-containing protein [Flavobacteriaceae bacterium]